MSSQWQQVLTSDQIAAVKARSSWDRELHAFYEQRTDGQLRADVRGAWMANDPDGYQNARSHLAARGVQP